MTKKLTAKDIEALAPNSGTTWDGGFPGLGVRVGKSRRTFFYFGRMKGEQAKRTITIGIYGEPVGDKPEPKWTIALARIHAGKIKGQLANGIDPTGKTPKVKEPTGPTLRDALELHLANMAKKNRSPRSIKTVRQGIELHLKAWLDRPMVELTSVELDKVHDQIIANTTARSNAVNPAGHALAKRIVVNVGTCWTALNQKHQGALGGWNPSKGVQTHALAPREARLGAKAESDMPWPVWYSRVLGLCGPRRDIQLLALFSSVRAEGLRNLRFEDINEEAGVFTVRITKGDRPYSVPMNKTIREIFARRRAENPELKLWEDYEGDDGWVFPTRTRGAPFAVVPLAEPKEWRIVKGKRVQHLPGLHPLRRTYASVAAEAGVDEFTIKILMNHTIAGVTGKHYTQLEDLERFAQAQATIEAALWARLTPPEKTEKTEKKTRRLRAV